MSWYQLASVLAEAEMEAQAELRRGPVCCPNDGEPLITGPDGHKFCPYDGYRP